MVFLGEKIVFLGEYLGSGTVHRVFVKFEKNFELEKFYRVWLTIIEFGSAFVEFGNYYRV